MCVSIYASDFPALILGIDVICISRILEHPKPIAIVHVFPAMVGDATWVLRVAHPRAVILQTTINAVRIVIVDAYVVKLRYRQVFAFPPFAAAIVGVPHSAVVSHEHYLGIGWIDPHVVAVAVRALKTANDRKAFPSVFTHNECSIGLEQAVRIFRVNYQLREVERSPHHPLAFIALLPCRAAIIGNEQSALGRLDKRVNALRFRWGDRHRQTSIRFLWKTFVSLLGNLRPAVAAVGRTEQSTS